MDIAQAQNISPVDALLSLVRSSYAHSVYADAVFSDALRRHVEGGGDILAPPPSVRPLMKEARQAQLAASRIAQNAVNAGAMIALAQRLDLEGSLVADALTAALDAIELEPEQRMRALGAAQERLMNAEDRTD